jgi:hypothetical protein
MPDDRSVLGRVEEELRDQLLKQEHRWRTRYEELRKAAEAVVTAQFSSNAHDHVKAIDGLRAALSASHAQEDRCSRCGRLPEEGCPEDGPGQKINTRMCPRKRPSASHAQQAKGGWTCPHGTTYTGSEDFVSGARNAADKGGIEADAVQVILGELERQLPGMTVKGKPNSAVISLVGVTGEAKRWALAGGIVTALQAANLIGRAAQPEGGKD